MMNVAFVCTGEFEPWIYDFVAGKLKEKGHNPYYVGFHLNTRAAIKKIKRPCYPDKIIKLKPDNIQDRGSL